MNLKTFLKNVLITTVLLLCLVFVVKFGGPAILRAYIQTGMGSCDKIPIFCMSPERPIITHAVNKEYVSELLPYRFSELVVFAPKGFNVIQHEIKKVYYKRRSRDINEAVIYALYEPPDFFINLFPQLRPQPSLRAPSEARREAISLGLLRRRFAPPRNDKVNNDYEFIRRVMSARLEAVENLTDAFFAIMKGLFTPDLGNQRNVRMTEFRIADKKGFINYNLKEATHYFDCNIFDKEANFFKVYIKDKKNILDLDKVLTIVAQIKATH